MGVPHSHAEPWRIILDKIFVDEVKTQLSCLHFFTATIDTIYLLADALYRSKGVDLNASNLAFREGIDPADMDPASGPLPFNWWLGG